MKYALLITICLYVTNAFGQVNMQYEEYLTGKLEASDIAAIRVVNSTGVDIDYIYKGWATDAEGKEVLRIQSKVLTQSRGVISYYQNNKFDARQKGDLKYKVISQSIDPASYSGSLTLHSELVHPLDTTSIIARETKEVFLNNGIYVTTEGKLITDPRLVSFDFSLRYDEKFTLDSLFTKLIFDNENEGECCLPLRFEITQGKDRIYAASTEQFCMSPGNSKMSPAQIRALNVEVNKYNTRDKNTPIKVAYRLGDSSGSRNLSNVAHSDFDFSFDRYTHYASGLSFDFINHATVTSPFSASSFAVVFDKNEALEKIEMLSRPGGTDIEALGMYHPFHSTLRREDFNGNVVISTFRKDNFSEAQWTELLAFMNKVDATDLLKFTYDDITIVAPKQLVNPRQTEGSNRIYKGYAFLIMDQERVTIYDAYHFSIPPDFPRQAIRDSLDIGKAMESISYNGVELDFVFENEKLKDLKFNIGKVLSQAKRKENFDKMRRYHYMVYQWPNDTRKNFLNQGKPDFEKLDQIIAEDSITNMSAVPNYVVVTPNEVKHLQYETISWDSIGIHLSYRAGEKAREALANRVEEYDYKEMYNIETSAYMMSGVSFSDKSEDSSKKVLGFTSNVLEIRPDGQLIELSRLNDTPKDPEWLKAIVRYQNLTKRDDPVGCKVHEVQDWTFYVPDKKLEKTRWQKETICFLVDSGQHLYRIKLSVPSVFDKEFILNSIQIEDKQFRFKFNGQNLESIIIR